jgi:hypothetical protein
MDIFSKLRHPGWAMMGTLGLAFVSTFSPEFLRGVLLFAAVLCATYIFFNTELGGA